MDDISDYFLLSGSQDDFSGWKDRLDQWLSVVQQVRTSLTNITEAHPAKTESIQSELAGATDSARISVRLGYTYLKYQYHRSVVCLTRSDKSYRENCLKSARAAIGLLKGLVAHSREVYHEIIW